MASLSLPKSKDWVKSSESRRKYGKFYTIWMYRRPILLVCDPEIAAELFEKGTNYASRPKLVVLTEVFGGKNHIVSMPHGKPWATRRKYLNLILKPSSLPMYQPRQEAEAVKLVSHLLRDSNSLVSSLDRYTASVVFSMAYGRRGMCAFQIGMN
jgi:cytochrome P450